MITKWLFPKTDDRITRARAGLLITACLGVIAAMIFIIGYWIVSGSLEDWETLVAAAILSLILLGIAALARKGSVKLGGWLLVGLLVLILVADVADYGLGSPTVAAFVIPIVLAACALGFWPGMAVAGVGVATAWSVAWVQTSGLGWFAGEAADISLLTFNAPAMTVIFILVGLIVGWWGKVTAGE